MKKAKRELRCVIGCSGKSLFVCVSTWNRLQILPTSCFHLLRGSRSSSMILEAEIFCVLVFRSEESIHPDRQGRGNSWHSNHAQTIAAALFVDRVRQVVVLLYISRTHLTQSFLRSRCMHITMFVRLSCLSCLSVCLLVHQERTWKGGSGLPRQPPLKQDPPP